MFKGWIPISVLLVPLAFNALAAETEDYNFKRTFQTSYGVVVFDHEAHAMGRVKDCATCHSALKTFGGISALFAHNFCKTCHASRNGPTECNGCHHNKEG